MKFAAALAIAVAVLVFRRVHRDRRAWLDMDPHREWIGGW